MYRRRSGFEIAPGKFLGGACMPCDDPRKWRDVGFAYTEVSRAMGGYCTRAVRGSAFSRLDAFRAGAVCSGFGRTRTVPRRSCGSGNRSNSAIAHRGNAPKLGRAVTTLFPISFRRSVVPKLYCSSRASYGSKSPSLTGSPTAQQPRSHVEIVL